MGGRLSRSKTRAPVRVPEPVSPFIPPHINNRPRRKRRGEDMALVSSKCRSTVEVEAPVVPSLTVAKKAERQSDSPIKPEPNAMEPSEEAKCAPSPSSSGAYDADQSDVCSERPEVVVEESGVPDSATGVVTQDMIDEENALKRQAEANDLQKREEREKEWARLEQEDKEERFERLKHLLQRSNMYTEYLINRMKRQQEEMTKKKERRQKKVAKEEEKKKVDESKAALKEEPSANGNGQEVAVPEITHNLRHKRKTEETDNTLSPKAAAPKRRRTAKTDEEKADKENDQAQKEAMEQMETEKKDGEAKKDGEKEEKGEIKKEGMDEVDGQTTSTSPKQTLSGGTLAPMKFNPFIADMGEARVYDGEAVPDAQPLMMTGGVLRPYQVDGYMWLRTLFENGMNGILADEMGLGKTVQCVAMLSHMVYMGVPGPFLICAPLSTIPNWYSEFQRFAPQVPVLLYHGHKEERKALRNKINRAHTVREGVVVRTVVITSYEVAMMDQRHLQRHEWKYMVVDEGHRIKNTQCRLISALRLYKTTNRLLLTGTPLQNNLAELWSLLNFLLPEIFDDLGSFEAWFDIEHIGDGIAADTQKKDVLSMLHQILTPFMLRRLKTDVDLRIPPKKEVIVYAPLLPLQKEFYSALIDRTIFRKIQEKNGTVEKEAVGANGRPVRKATKNKIDYSLMIASDKDEKECKTSRQKANEEEEIEGWVQAMVEMQAKRETKVAPEQRVSQLTIKLRNVMMQLRKCCSHPFLLEHPLDKKTGELSLDERVISQSGKMLVLDRMLGELHKRGHKVLIFSQMTKMLDLLEDFCVLRNYGYCRLDGAMNINDRRDNMLEYQKEKSDKFVFLLSTRAGGLGINLTAADTVVIYDSDWNPQCDLQAQDRCHRIGQTRPVMVYRFVTANTIDQRIVERAAAKRKLEKLVIHQGKFKSGIKNFKTSLEPVSSEELLELLNSKDHESEVGQASDEVISDADLDLLLDRSDLERRWKAKQAQADADEEMAVEEEDINIESLLGCLTSKPSTTASTKPTTRQSPNQPTATKPSPAQRRSAGRGKGSAKKNAKSNSTPTPAPVAKSLLFKVIDVDDGRPVKMKCEPTAS